jgi:hypothetical protein
VDWFRFDTNHTNSVIEGIITSAGISEIQRLKVANFAGTMVYQVRCPVSNFELGVSQLVTALDNLYPCTSDVLH